ncbi:MAG: TonB-dependent receptor [Sedimentisphaerales bacterium]|nr:TonB-dependent receptor [Sedimentisphaerales bacterium]
MKITINPRFFVNIAVLAIILFLIPTMVSAEEAEKPEDQVADSSLPVGTYTLEDVVITASRHEALLKNTPDTVQIITRQDIEEINPTSTGELFRYITGASIESGTGSGLPSRSVIGLDGLSADRTLVMIDGVKLLTEHIHSGQNVDFIPPKSIERIEILRGAASAQYGSDAIGGVINIITRKAKAGDPVEMDFGFTTGSYGYFDSGMGLLAPIGEKIRLSHFLSWEQCDGVDIEAPAHRKGYMGYDRFNNYNRVDVDYSEDTSLFGVWNYTRYSMDWSRSPHRVDGRLGSQVLGMNHRITDDLDLTVHAAYSSWKADQSLEENNFFEPQIFLNWRGLQNHTMVTGFDYKYNEFDRSGLSSAYEQSAYAWFFLDTWNLTEEWTLASAVRGDKYEGIDGAVSPKVSLMYKPSWLDNNYIVRASVGRSFHAPSLQELYEEGYGHGGRARRYGNPNLDPEYAMTYSLGLDVTPDKPFSTTWRVFRTDFDDMIVPYYTGPVPGDPAHDVWRRMNIAEARVYGAEASLRLKITDRLKFDAGCTYTENERMDTGGQLPYTAGTTIFTKLTMTQPITTGLRVRAFVGAYEALKRESWSWQPAAGASPDDPSGLVTPLDDYINLSTGVSFFLGENLELFVRAENLLGDEIATLDDVYTVRQGDPAYYGGFNYRILF